MLLYYYNGSAGAIRSLKKKGGEEDYWISREKEKKIALFPICIDEQRKN